MSIKIKDINFNGRDIELLKEEDYFLTKSFPDNFNYSNKRIETLVFSNNILSTNAICCLSFPNVKFITSLNSGLLYMGVEAVKKISFSNLQEIDSTVSSLSYETAGRTKILDLGFVTNITHSNSLFTSNKSETQFNLKFKHLILRGNSICVLAESVKGFELAEKDNEEFYIYVPKAIIESYSDPTNWNISPEHFRPLEDYEENDQYEMVPKQ